MDIRPIRSEADYEWALGEIAAYFETEPEPGTPDADRFDVLSDLIEIYEATHWPVTPPDPVEAVRYWMEIKNLDQPDLAKLFGSRSRASEVLARKRALTMDMIQKLNRAWSIPAEILIQPYPLKTSRKRRTTRRKAA